MDGSLGLGPVDKETAGQLKRRALGRRSRYGGTIQYGKDDDPSSFLPKKTTQIRQCRKMS